MSKIKELVYNCDFEIGDKITYRDNATPYWGTNIDTIYTVRDIFVSEHSLDILYKLSDEEDYEIEYKHTSDIDSAFKIYNQTEPCPSCGEDCEIVENKVEIGNVEIGPELFRCENGCKLIFEGREQYGGDSGGQQ